MTQVRVGRGQCHLAKLVKVKLLVLCAIVLSNDIVGVGHARAQIVLAHEVVELRDADLTVATPIEVLEKLHWLEIRVTAQVLPLHLNLHAMRGDKRAISLKSESKKKTTPQKKKRSEKLTMFSLVAKSRNTVVTRRSTVYEEPPDEEE